MKDCMEAKLHFVNLEKKKKNLTQYRHDFPNLFFFFLRLKINPNKISLI